MKLKKEFEYYRDHQKELVKKYDGKFLVIKGTEVIGVFDNEIDAYDETIKEHELGTFLIQHCIPGEEGTTTSFYTNRVILA